MTKNPTIDLLKGVLILLVMLGHAMEVAQQQYQMMWIGAGFRMPLMIGISGYLLNVSRIRTLTARQMIDRYGERMLVPWLIALTVYVIMSGRELDWVTPIDMLMRPPFHLWYVPVLFFLVMLTRTMPLSPLLLLAVGMPCSLAIMVSFGLNHGTIGHSLFAPDSRFLRYPVYFFFGMLMAERGLPRRYVVVPLLMAGLGMMCWSGLGSKAHPIALMAARLWMCLGLIALLPLLSRVRLQVGVLNVIGRDSLFFYLWHPLVMALLLASGVDAVMMFLITVPGLFAASRAVALSTSMSRLLGATRRKHPLLVLPEPTPLGCLR